MFDLPDLCPGTGIKTISEVQALTRQIRYTTGKMIMGLMLTVGANSIMWAVS
jgi:hypothetical protein